MSNERKTIRDNMKTALLAASAVTALVGTRVVIGRGNVFGEEAETALPCIFVYPMRDEVDTNSMSVSRNQLHQMTMIADYWCKSSSVTVPIEDTIDAGLDALTPALLADTTQDGACEDTILTSAEYMIDGSENNSIGTGRATFTVKYFTRES